MTANHLDTDFNVLDRLSRTVDATQAAEFAQHDAVHGAVVVSTCNRFEVYLDVDEHAAADPAVAQSLLGALDEQDAKEIASAAVRVAISAVAASDGGSSTSNRPMAAIDSSTTMPIVATICSGSATVPDWM